MRIQLTLPEFDQTILDVIKAFKGLTLDDCYNKHNVMINMWVPRSNFDRYLTKFIQEGKVTILKGKIYAQPLYSGTAGVYSCVSVLPESLRPLNLLAEYAGFTLDKDLHATIMWCKNKGIPEHKVSEFSNSIYKAKVGKLAWWAGHDADGYLVLLLDSPTLRTEHTRLTELGCNHSFPDYTPHITLVKNVDEPSVQQPFLLRLANQYLRKNPFSINLGNQRIEDIK
jgi:hypothetical protein